MRPVRCALLVAAVGGLAARAHAVDLGIEARAGYFDLSNAHQSAKAVFDGSSGGPTFGGALRLGLGERYFVRGGASYFKRTGERVFIADATSDVFPLGHPLEVSLVPIYLDLGRTFRPDGTLRPYVGIGAGISMYKEESTVAEETTSVERSRASGRLLVGTTYGRGSLQLGLEAAYSIAPDTIGLGGVSKIYEETDAGGFQLVVLLRWQP